MTAPGPAGWCVSTGLWLVNFMASFFGSTAAKPAASPKLSGLDSTRTSSNEQAVALRYFAGVQRMALNWLSDAYNIRTKEVKSQSGGKGSSSSTTEHANAGQFRPDGTRSTAQ